MRTWRRAFLILIAAALLLWAVWPRERLLFRRAVPVASTARWGDAIRWLSSRELLFSRDPDDAFFRYELTTKQETPLTALNRLYRRANPAGERVTTAVSPNGQWMLWSSLQTTRPQSLRTYVAAMDGSRCIPPAMRDWSTAWCWLPDSRRWLELADEEAESTFRLRAINDGHVIRTITIKEMVPEGESWLDDTVITSADHMLWGAKRLKARDGAKAVIVEADLQSKSPVVRRFPIRLPPGAEAISISFSPRGDRVAWYLELHQSPSPVRRLLHRLLPVVRADTQTVEGVWVSRLDGSEMQEIGHFVKKYDGDWAYNILWQPDGRRLSFLYQDRLWIVPAD
jgi:hypothetical protein